MMSNRPLATMILLCVLLFPSTVQANSLSIVAPSARYQQTQTPEEIQTRVAQVKAAEPIYQENFDQDSGDWNKLFSENAERFYRGGSYHIDVKVPLAFAAGENVRVKPDDFYLEADVTYVAGSPENRVGVIFRQYDDRNFYFFFISNTGSYGLEKQSNGIWETILVPAPSNAIQSGENVVNTLGVLALSTKITLFANGEALITITDDSHFIGNVGFGLSTLDQQGEGAFDNLRVWSAKPILQGGNEVLAQRERVLKATVYVVAPNVGTGSGTIMDATHGYILTNYHVVADEENGGYANNGYMHIGVMPANLRGSPEIKYMAEVVDGNSELDLAVLQIKWLYPDTALPLPSDLGLTAIGRGDSDQLQIGDTVFAVGYPGAGGNTVTLTQGLVSGFLDEDSDSVDEWIKTDAEINYGNSGGLSVNAQGNFIGVPTRFEPAVFQQSETQIEVVGKISNLRTGNLALQYYDRVVTRYGNTERVQNRLGAIKREVAPFQLHDDFGRARNVLYWLEDESKIGFGIVPLWQSAFILDSTAYMQGGPAISPFSIAQRKLWARVPTVQTTESLIHELSASDFLYEIDAALTSGPSDANYSLLFRYRNEDNHYYFAVRQTGVYGLWKKVDGEWIELVPWTSSNAIKTGRGVTNRLAVLAEGPRITLLINEERLTEVVDSTFLRGRFGLAVGTLDTADAVVVFDNLDIWGL